MNFALKKIVIPAAVFIFFSGCAKIDLFEKNIPIKKHEWQRSVKPSVTFKIEDTVSLYNLYVVLRHFDSYNYNNLWMNVYTKSPGDSVRRQQLDLQLADNEK